MGGIMDALYAELRALAARRMRVENRHHTLQPTALVNEAYLRLMRGPVVINDRRHFFALAAGAMRHVLCDHARQKYAGKRGGRMDRVTLGLAPGVEPLDVDVLALDEALTALSKLDPRAAQVVELRFFGGLTLQETARVLGISVATAKNDWAHAKAWLFARLTPGSSGT
jgi:RNA polymerase sigma factor (TIGR02999 family)